MLDDATMRREAQVWLDEQWETVIADLAQVIAIESAAGEPDEASDAPFGPGPRKALDWALEKAAAYGFETEDCAGACGTADLLGSDERQLGIIGHLDVVPASQGWHFPPFQLTRKDGFLLGRGTTDDKGPLICAMHAVRFWSERCRARGEQLPHTVRLIFGCNEESGMRDAELYLAAHPAPDFLFTPDADFPVCYGEKGQFQAWLESAPLPAEGSILSFEGGEVVNGVPGEATAIVRAGGEVDRLVATDRVSVEVRQEADAGARAFGDAAEGESREVVFLQARGIGGHAAEPEGSVNAVAVLVNYLLEKGIGSDAERTWLAFAKRILDTTDGSGLGIATSDADFGPLTCVGSMARMRNGRFAQSIDVRFPATTSCHALTSAVDDAVQAVGGRVEVTSRVEPLLVDPDTAPVKALQAAYEEVAGRPATLFTMGGGTYAHHFPVGVSFGAKDDAAYPKPDWVGSMHGPDEGMAEEAFKQALLIYIVAIGKLMDEGF